MTDEIKKKTRNYIKHQDTWFKNKFNDFNKIETLEEILSNKSFA